MLQSYIKTQRNRMKNTRTKPLNQEEFTMKIIEDLGITTANENTIATARYAIFECTVCNKHFKARATGATARKQTSCIECTKSESKNYKHPLYAIWNGIKQRCYAPKRKDYHKYGGIGVTMSDEFKNSVDTFIEFCLTNGWKPELIIDKDIKCRELGISPTIYSRETLSFITVQENAEEANAKIVLQYSLNNEFIAEYVSTVVAAVSIGKSRNARSSIANCCRGTAHTAFGFKWKYK